MSDSISLVDAVSLGDLKVFLGRSARIGCESVRMIGGSGVLAAYVAALTPHGLLDDAPTVLGLRTFALGEARGFDVVVPVRAMLDRLAQHSLVTDHAAGPVQVPLPALDGPVAWAGIAPPRGGWFRRGEVSIARLNTVAGEGVAEVADALPDHPGESLARRVRAEVWGRAIPGLDESLPAGAAFTAHALGFLHLEDVASLHRSGRWTRLTTRRGHVLARLASVSA